MGHSNSKLIKAIKDTLDNDTDLYAFPGEAFYQLKHVKPYNLDRPVEPAAITYPKTKEQVAAIVKVAVEHGAKVQARSGGHSYANYCIGGVDGCVVIDMKHFQRFEMDRQTWRATVGAGMLLGDLTEKMHDAGNRAMAHGTCK
jgi:FAD/FMN-containing dehydrogenase